MREKANLSSALFYYIGNQVWFCYEKSYLRRQFHKLYTIVCKNRCPYLILFFLCHRKVQINTQFVVAMLVHIFRFLLICWTSSEIEECGELYSRLYTLVIIHPFSVFFLNEHTLFCLNNLVCLRLKLFFCFQFYACLLLANKKYQKNRRISNNFFYLNKFNSKFLYSEHKIFLYWYTYAPLPIPILNLRLYVQFI